ncbi:MAG: hypothetical protein K5894_05830 [Lachnospiraceae bacterium]|nr:hypothetical protein [Lachnospiraceae bacterium]
MSYTVVAGSYLNKLYGEYKNYINGSVRKNAANTTLVLADSTALKRGAIRMSKMPFETSASEDTDDENEFFYKNFRAFMDTLNNTLDSSSDSSSTDIKKLSKKIKSLSSDYEDQLSKLGISIDDSGYWSVDEDTFKGISNKKFEKVFGEDSEFSKEVKKLAKKIIKHVNTLI